jgi:hypothetical protein
MPKKSNRQQTESKYSEAIYLRVEAGTLARVDEVLERFEDRSHMLRQAIEGEIKRRERKQREG